MLILTHGSPPYKSPIYEQDLRSRHVAQRYHGVIYHLFQESAYSPPLGSYVFTLKSSAIYQVPASTWYDGGHHVTVMRLGRFNNPALGVGLRPQLPICEF